MSSVSSSLFASTCASHSATNRHTFHNSLAPTKRNLYGVFPKNQLFADLNRTQPVAKGVQLRRQLAAEATGDLAAEATGDLAARPEACSATFCISMVFPFLDYTEIVGG